MFPIAFKLGPVYLTSFGLSLAVAFFLSLFFAHRAIKDHINVSIEELFDSIFLIALGAFAGARIAYIILNFQAFDKEILSYILIREKPGLSYTGAVLGGSLIYWLRTKTASIAWRRIVDDLTTSLVVVFLVGHLGAFLDGISFGRETSFPWGISILGEARLRHPLPLFHVLFLVFFLLFLPKIRRLTRERRWSEGSVLLLFAASYSGFASLMNIFQEEMTRVDSYPIDLVFNLMLLTVFSLALYIRNRRFFGDIKFILAFIRETVQNSKRWTLRIIKSK